MIKRVLMSGLIFATLSTLLGCATEQFPDQSFVQAKPVIQRPSLIQVPSARANYHLIYGNDPALARAFNRYAATGKAPNIITDGFVKFAYNAGQQPIVKATPFQETVISLEPGERFTNITSGDPNRWSYSVAVSGSGASQQQNVLVKPSLPNISTNMVITTDRRIYNLRLVSSMNAQTTRNVSFWYPDEMVDAVNDATLKQFDGTVASVPDVSLNNLNFDYSISSGFFCRTPAWRPTRVFDDGTHTYIQFGAKMTNRDMPALFVLDGNTQELVNYRSKLPYFVVDKIFKQAVLVMGVGHSQTKVTITNNRY